jgi:L,D-peptidoglycan transpeptidase YkuD (ErfK/YbiS/YcfS/YnhG family)
MNGEDGEDGEGAPVGAAPGRNAHWCGRGSIGVLAGVVALASALVVARTAPRAGATTAAPVSCAPNLADRLATTEGAGQVVTIETTGYRTTVAELTAWQRVGRCFVRVAGPWTAAVGVSGLSDHHMEGDGSTPTGAYRIGPTMYGVAADPGVAYPYHRLECGDWWDEDPTTPGYNTFQHLTCGARPPFAGGSEALWTEVPAYEHFAVVEYNAHPVVAGRGSAIFLHVSTGLPTDGCIAIPEQQLDIVLRWLLPARHPLVVIGTAAEIRRF